MASFYILASRVRPVKSASFISIKLIAYLFVALPNASFRKPALTFVLAFASFIGVGFRSLEPAGERGSFTFVGVGLVGLASMTSCGVLSSLVIVGVDDASVSTFRRRVRIVSPTFAWPQRLANCKVALDSAVEAGDGETLQIIRTLLPSRVIDGCNA